MGAVQCCLLDMATQELTGARVTCSRPARVKLTSALNVPAGSINWTCWVTKKKRGEEQRKQYERIRR